MNQAIPQNTLTFLPYSDECFIRGMHEFMNA